MKIRELLQTEIWSKRTTRKIWKVVGTVVVVTVLWIGVDHYWLTPFERKAARTALAKIDALGKSEGLPNEEFDAQLVEAKKAVDVAQRKAWTTRDRSTFELLSLYVDMTDNERREEGIVFPSKYANYKDSLKSSTQMSKTLNIYLGHELHAMLYE